MSFCIYLYLFFVCPFSPAVCCTLFHIRITCVSNPPLGCDNEGAIVVEIQFSVGRSRSTCPRQRLAAKWWQENNKKSWTVLPTAKKDSIEWRKGNGRTLREFAPEFLRIVLTHERNNEWVRARETNDPNVRLFYSGFDALGEPVRNLFPSISYFTMHIRLSYSRSSLTLLISGSFCSIHCLVLHRTAPHSILFYCVIN